jgi:hypothetical protein
MSTRGKRIVVGCFLVAPLLHVGCVEGRAAHQNAAATAIRAPSTLSGFRGSLDNNPLQGPSAFAANWADQHAFAVFAISEEVNSADGLARYVALAARQLDGDGRSICGWVAANSDASVEMAFDGMTVMVKPIAGKTWSAVNSQVDLNADLGPLFAAR